MHNTPINTIRAVNKILILFLAPLTLSLITLLATHNYLKSKQPTKDTPILITNYQSTPWKDLGEVFEPTILLPVYYQKKGYQKVKFLLDSGAVISSLSREHAEPMGFSLAKLPRLTFTGFGNTASFAYRATAKIRIASDILEIPIVFTESTNTTPVLGRMGFFEKYTINFDHKMNRVEIIK